MDKLIYTAMSGASAAAHRQSVLANNLANVSTQGFRAELASYRAVPLRGDGASTRVFAIETTTGHLDAPGSAQQTGRNLDVMAQGNAWFAVQGLDGTEAYTRAGSFHVSAEGNLQTIGGLNVLADGGAPINAPLGSNVTIGSDGTVTAQVGNQPPNNIGRLKMVTPGPDAPIKRSPDGLFRTPTNDPLPLDATARLASGQLESSNVNAVENMVGMIQTARQFETQMRLLQTAESNDRSAAQLLNLQG